MEFGTRTFIVRTHLQVTTKLPTKTPPPIPLSAMHVWNFHKYRADGFVWNGSKFYKTKIVNMELIRPLKNKNLNCLFS